MRARAADRVGFAAERLTALLASDDYSSDSHALTVPAYVIDWVAAAHALPVERCWDDCMTLAHAYAHLGVDAEVRVAEIIVFDPGTGAGLAYTDLEPQWRDGIFDGHTVVWLPALGVLVDVTVAQYLPGPGLRLGPLVVAADPIAEPGVAPGGERLTVRYADAAVAYRLAPLALTHTLEGHPAASEQQPHHPRRGMNLAAKTLALLNEHAPASRLAEIPHPRIAALCVAIRDRADHRTDQGDWRFSGTDAEGRPDLLRLDQVPVPLGTAPCGTVNGRPSP